MFGRVTRVADEKDPISQLLVAQATARFRGGMASASRRHGGGAGAGSAELTVAWFVSTRNGDQTHGVEVKLGRK